jgi:hypothetical protein
LEPKLVTCRNAIHNEVAPVQVANPAIAERNQMRSRGGLPQPLLVAIKS